MAQPGLQIFFQFQTLMPRCSFIEDAFVIILGTSLDRTSFTTKICATIVPLFKDFFGPIPPIHILLSENYNLVPYTPHFLAYQHVKI